MAEECAISRLYAGIHFPVDNEEGLRLGRQIGEIVVAELKKQKYSSQKLIDDHITEDKKLKLPPPPYEQILPYLGESKCNSTIDRKTLELRISPLQLFLIIVLFLFNIPSLFD